ncbi:hypothetical protein B0H13DRAFT_2113748 [Mycena leptocephala]|nr:hypothetical protein B0H13DRAFT_2113748 [Mycena leptocephala]
MPHIKYIQYLASITIWVLSHFTTARRPQRWWTILNVHGLQYSQKKNNTFYASSNVIPERKSFQTTPSFHSRCSRLISKIRYFTALV